VTSGTSQTGRDLTALPKTDLHVHLEGSIRAATLAQLAAGNGTDLPADLRDGRYEFRDFPHFITQWVAVLQSLRTREDFRRIAVEFCRDEAAQGVRYAEAHFSLPEHGPRVGEWDLPVEGVLEGFADGGSDWGITCALIVDVVRGLDLGLSRRAMEVAVAYAGAGVVGLGLGGSESHPPEAYEGIFRAGMEAGLHSVPHAGETQGPAGIRAAVAALRAERIGHGIRVLEDPRLVEDLAARGIPFDVCPTSNVMTRVVPSLEHHPLPGMIRAGLTVTLNSDDPAMFSSPVAGEYEAARRVFGFEDSALADLARAGARASFADGETRLQLERGIDEWLST